MNKKNLFRNLIIFGVLVVIDILLFEFTNCHLAFGPIIISFTLLPIALAAVYLDTTYAAIFGLIYGMRFFMQEHSFRNKSIIGAVFLFVVSYVALVILLSLIYKVLIKNDINRSICSGIVFALALPLRLCFQKKFILPLFFSMFPTGWLSEDLYYNTALTWYIPEMIAFFIIGFLISFILNKLKNSCLEKYK